MNERTEAALKVIAQFLSDIREHVDSVQVLASYEKDEADNKDTASIFKGSGNFHARVGMAREFLIEDDQRTRNYVTSQDDDCREDDPP